MRKLYFFIVAFFVGFCAGAQIIDIPDPAFKNALVNTACNYLGNTSVDVDSNNNGEIELSEALSVTELKLDGPTIHSITSLAGIENFTNLIVFMCRGTTMTALDVSSLTQLKELYCDSNMFTSLTINSNLEQLQCYNNQLSSFDLSTFTNLKSLVCDNNLFTSLDLSSLTMLSDLSCGNNQLTSLILPAQVWLVYCPNNLLTEVNIANLELLNTFVCENNQLTHLEINPNLSVLDCSGNQLTSLDISQMNWHGLDFSYNQISEIVVPPQHELYDLYLNISGNLYTQIEYPVDVPYASFICSDTQLSEIKLPYVEAGADEYNIIMNNPHLQYIDAKNGFNQLCPYNPEDSMDCNLYIANNPNLQFFCTDENEASQDFIDYTNTNNDANIVFSSYCNFAPGGNFNTVTGSIKFDFAGNGCDNNDIAAINIPVKIHPAGYPDYNGRTFTNDQGNYTNYTTSYFGVDDVVIKPQFENAYFTISPDSFETSFTDFGNIQQANFCITPNGTHPDLEISLFALSAARPGFDAHYKIIYKNKGTETQSGNVTLNFADATLDFVSADPATDVQAANVLTWNFSNLAPFQTREIAFTLHVNSPMETPAVNIGDVLDFTASVLSQADETPGDNVAVLAQTVVGAYDPNDKTVAEGAFINTSQLDDYLHYTIRFQNTGTAAAENVVVKDSFLSSANSFDLTSLQIVGASHPYQARLSGFTKLELIFENINLPPASTDEPGSHGYVTFKIKPRSTLPVGSMIENTAEIYFDFNFPIVTNTVVTAVAPLAIQSFENSHAFVVYPNPVSGILNLRSNSKIDLVEIINNLGQSILKTTNTNAVDVSNLASGIYFIKAHSPKGSTTRKFLKL